jgi:4-aminobutyrate aminotransferase-like enzyme
LLLRCGSHGQVVRWLPPLTVSRAEIDRAVALFRDALGETA